MELREALARRRSIRRFQQIPVSEEAVDAILEAAMLAPSAANSQPLRYYAVESEEVRNEIFRQTAWGGHVKPRRNPVEGVTSPMLYLVVTGPRDESGGETVSAKVDAGAAIENMLLRCLDFGLGGCWIGAFNRTRVEEILNVPKERTVLYVTAFGVPDESPVSERIEPGDSTKYYLDGHDVLHVPKYEAGSVTEYIRPPLGNKEKGGNYGQENP